MGKVTSGPIMAACINIAPWASKYLSEILEMIKNGFTSAKKIIAELKKRHNIK